MNRRRATSLAYLLGAVVAIAIAAVLVVWVAPDIPGARGLRDAAKRSEEIGRNRTAILALLAGALAIVGAIYTARNYALSHRGQITDRFFKAVEQLDPDSSSPAVRLGAVYALSAIVDESPRERDAVTNVLLAFIYATPGDDHRTDAATIAALNIVDRLGVGAPRPEVSSSQDDTSSSSPSDPAGGKGSDGPAAEPDAEQAVTLTGWIILAGLNLAAPVAVIAGWLIVSGRVTAEAGAAAAGSGALVTSVLSALRRGVQQSQPLIVRQRPSEALEQLDREIALYDAQVEQLEAAAAEADRTGQDSVVRLRYERDMVNRQLAVAADERARLIRALAEQVDPADEGS